MSSPFAKVPLSIRILLGVMIGMFLTGGVTLTIVFRQLNQQEKEREKQRAVAMDEAKQIRAALIQAGTLLKITPTVSLPVLSWTQRIMLDKLPKEQIELLSRRKPETGQALMRLKTQLEEEIENKPLPKLKEKFQKILMEYCRHADHEKTLEAEFVLSKLKSKLPPEDETVQKSLAELKPKELTAEDWNNFKAPRMQEIKDMFANGTVNTARINVILKELEKKRPQFYGNDDIIPLNFKTFERSIFTRTLCQEALEKAANDYEAALKSDTLTAAELEGHITKWNTSLTTLKSCAQVTVSPKPFLDQLNTVEKVRDHYLRPAWNVFVRSLRNIFLQSPGSDPDKAVEKAIDTLNAQRKRYGDFSEPERNDYSLANWRARIFPLVMKDAHELVIDNIMNTGLNMSDETRQTLQDIIGALTESCEADMKISEECAPAEWKAVFSTSLDRNFFLYFKYPTPAQRRFELMSLKYTADWLKWHHPSTTRPEQVAPLISKHAELLKFLADHSLSRDDFDEIRDPPSDFTTAEKAVQKAADNLAKLDATSLAAQEFAKKLFVCHFEIFWPNVVMANPVIALTEANKLKTAIEALPPNYDGMQLRAVLSDLLPHLKAAILRATAASKFITIAQTEINSLINSNEFQKSLFVKDPHFVFEQDDEELLRQKLATDNTIFRIQSHLFVLARNNSMDVRFRALLTDIDAWIAGTQEPDGVVIVPKSDLTLQRKLLPVTAKAFYFSVYSAIKFAELKVALTNAGLKTVVVDPLLFSLSSHFVDLTATKTTPPLDVLTRISKILDPTKNLLAIKAYCSYLISVLLSLGQQQKLIEWTTLGFYKDAHTRRPYLLLLSEKHVKMGTAVWKAWNDLHTASQSLPVSSEEAQINARLIELATQFTPIANKISDGLNPTISAVTELDVGSRTIGIDKLIPIYREYKKLKAKLVLLRTATPEGLEHLAKCSYLDEMANIISKLPLIAEIKKTVFQNNSANIQCRGHRVEAQRVTGVKFSNRTANLLEIINLAAMPEIKNHSINDDVTLQNSFAMSALFDLNLPEKSFIPFFDAVLAAQEMVSK